MTDRTKIGFDILKVASGIGILGDILLRVMPWGLNVFLFNLAFVAGAIFLFRQHAPQRLTVQTWSLLGAQVFFSAMFVWRDSVALRFADSLAILAILSALFLPKFGIAQRVAGVAHYAAAFLMSSLNAVFSPFALAGSDIKWKSDTSTWRRHAASGLRGVAIATPLVLVFGLLFMSADAAFEGFVQRTFNFDPTIAFTHAALFGVFAWLTAGYLRGAIMPTLAGSASAAYSQVVDDRCPDDRSTTNADDPASNDEGSHMDRVREDSGEYPVTLPNDRTVIEHINITDPPFAASGNKTEDATSTVDDTADGVRSSWPNIDNTVIPSAFTLGTVEVAIILGLMNLLFLSFVIMQVPYLFGGMELVQTTPDFKLAEYARRGFGELVAVSALVLPVLLAGHWLIKKDVPAARKVFTALAALQIGLLFVIMASAAQRLLLLTGSLGYGMTTVRLYPMIFMAWLAVVFVWFGATVLRGARQYFAWGALWTAFVVLGAAHALNPDAFIVRTNVALAQQGRDFDAYYNSRLSDDALPELIGSFEKLNSEDQEAAVKWIALRYCEKREEGDLRSWNMARSEAFSLLDSNHEFVAAVGRCYREKYGMVGD